MNIQLAPCPCFKLEYDNGITGETESYPVDVQTHMFDSILNIKKEFDNLEALGVKDIFLYGMYWTDNKTCGTIWFCRYAYLPLNIIEEKKATNIRLPEIIV